MDWIHQNKLKNWLIGGLLALNVLALSILWMQTAKTHEAQRKEQGVRPSGSVKLLTKALDLTEEQTNQLVKIQTSLLEQLTGNNDQLDKIKMQLAEDLFKNNPDTSRAIAKTKEIGELESKVELLRFMYFQELLAICTPEQKEKLKPIVFEVIGRKPPKEESENEQQKRNGREEESPPDNNVNKDHSENPQNYQDGKPGPLSVDEQLAKYSERLNLTGEQKQKVRAVLMNSHQKGEELRMRSNPDQDVMHGEMENIRKEEDENIMKTLNKDQKREFAKMISNRRK